MANNPTVSTANLRGHIARLEAKNARLRRALEEIRDKDYRGNSCSCSTVAYRALLDKETSDD